MKTEVKLTESIGKTLAAVAFSESYCKGQCVLAFTDGTFATLGIDRGCERGEDWIMQEELSLFDFGDDELVRAGIVTAEEIATMRKDRDRKLAAERDARLRQEFERLKCKFGV